MSTITEFATSSRRATRLAAAAIATAAAVATAFTASPSAHAATPEPCAALATGGSCTINETNEQFESIAIPYGVDTITAIVAGAGGPHSTAPMHGGWTTVGTFLLSQLGHQLDVRVGRMGDGNGAGGDTIITDGLQTTSKVIVDSAGGSTGNGWSDARFNRMADYPNLGGNGSVTLIAQSAIDLTGNDSFAARTLPIPSNTHHFRVFMAGGAGSRAHNHPYTYGDGAVISGTLDTRTATSWNYYVGESAYDGGFGYGHPGLGGNGNSFGGLDGGDGGGASLLIDDNSAQGVHAPVLSAGGGGGAGGDVCPTSGPCNLGGQGGTAGGSGKQYPRDGQVGFHGSTGGHAGNGDPINGIDPDGHSGGDAHGTFITETSGGGGGGGAGYPQGGQGGDGGSGSASGAGGGGGSGASYADPNSVTGMRLTTTASCTDGFIIIIPLV